MSEKETQERDLFGNIIATKEMEMTAIPTAFSYLQKLIREKPTQQLEADLNELEAKRSETLEIQVSLPFINDTVKTQKPLVEKFQITADNYTQIFQKLLDVKDPDTSQAMLTLYQYMYAKKSFNIDKIDGKELMELAGYKDIRPEFIDKTLRSILKYLNITITILDPVKTKEAKANKHSRIDKVYKNFTVLQVGEFGTKNKDDDNQKEELLLELSNVKFMDGYMDFINLVSRKYIPLQTIHTISIKDKKRYFVTNVCDILSSLKKKPYIIKKSLEECMKLGDFFYKRWKSEKKRAWKPIESCLIEAREKKLLQYKWIFRKIKTHEVEADKLEIDSNNELIKVEFADKDKLILTDKFYKYIEAIEIERLYNPNPKETSGEKDKQYIY